MPVSRRPALGEIVADDRNLEALAIRNGEVSGGKTMNCPTQKCPEPNESGP